MPESPDVEDLLAQALAAHDAGPAALAAFLDEHPAHRTVLERGLERCRRMGLLGAFEPDALRDFPDRLGPFRLLRRLGVGGMGTVFEAQQEELQRRVALKVIRPELLYVAGARERFRREVEAIGRLDHPAIVGILAAGEHEGIPYFAMPLLAGASLAEVVLRLRGRPLASLRGSDLRAAILGGSTASSTTAAAEPAEVPPAEFAGTYWEAIVHAGIQAGSGVAHAHAHGIVHRDLKPGNVMLLPDGRALVLDFGVARVHGARELTRSAEPGSPAFMSPEQLAGAPTDERTDVYSLGLTLWQGLTREPPFAAGSTEALVLRGELSPLPRGRGLPRDLAIVLQKATDRDRQRRYASMAELVDDLRAVLERRPIRGRRLPWSLRTWRRVQRHRVASAVLATLALAALAVPLGLRAERAAAERAVQDAAQRAEQSLLATLDTLAAAEERFGGADLPDVAEVDPLARAQLEDSLRRYRELLATHAAHPRLSRQAAAAMYRAGQVQARAGNGEAAAALYDEGLRTLGELGPGRTGGATADATADGAADAGTPNATVEAFELRGSLQLALAALAIRRLDLTEARAFCERARTDFDALEAMAPGSVASLRARGELAINLAKLHPERSELDANERHLRAALALAETWRRTHPDSVDALLTLVRRHSSLGVLLRRAGDGTAAEPHLREAVALSRTLPDNNRLWPPPRALQSMALESYANLLLERGDQAARPLLEECIALREALTERLPEQRVFRVHLGNAYQNLGRHLLLAGDAAAAEPWLRRACSVQLALLAEQPDFADAKERLEHHRYALARCLAELGKLDELLENGERLAESVGNAVALHTAAWSFLRALAHARGTDREAELRSRYAARCQALLERVAELGWDPVWRLEDPVYDELRGTPAFVALQARLGRAAK
ncbi:MAG: serine/threonine protein kinase [Planctomycetes bacterium]|nr:serine/threonine protein kinase [Planctomycetota bacterium]